MKSFLVNIIEKYHPFNVKYFKLVVVLAITSLSAIVLILGWMSSRKVREVVTQDFNQQQLVIAKYAATQVIQRIESLKRELTLLSLSPTIQYAGAPYLGNRLNITFSSVSASGVMKIIFLYYKTRSAYHVSSDATLDVRAFDREDMQYLGWGGKEENKNSFYLSAISRTFDESESQKLIMKMGLPVWQSSVSEIHPVPTNKFSGVLIFVIESCELVKNIVKDIRSGKTGYAWVIDETGTFLYHHEKEFIGRNAFEARKEKEPGISFERIDKIQKEKMMKGEEGENWYVTGWHRGVEQTVKKMIAYAPIKLADKHQARLWSVAVVAPLSEIEGAIHSVNIRQIFLQAVIIVIIILGGSVINFMILGWSNMLETEVSRKTKELIKSEQRYKSLVENAEDIIFSVDYEGNFLSINKYGTKIFGRNEKDIVGRNLSEIYSWPSHEMLLLMIQKVFETKESKEITLPATIKDLQYWFNTKLRRLFDESGNIYAVLGISRDITATRKKEIEEQLHHTEKLASMGTLAAGVAHEINNPLAIILGFTDLLLENTDPKSGEYATLKAMEKHGLHVKKVVEELLSFARYSEQSEEICDINKSLRTVLSIVRNTLVLSNIQLREDMQSGLPLIKGDPGQFQQVFLNIVNNAMHAMKGGGILTVRTGLLEDGRVEIRFEDTGHGIKKDHRKKIFDPLFTTKSVGEGTGLGLSVSYGIIKQHGGEIRFETKTEEEDGAHGTTFIITLPASNISRNGGDNA